MPELHLVTIGPSHYCEKARWALDRAGLPFTEEAHVPMVHWLFTLPRSGTRTVPVLLTSEGALTESTAIVRFADRGLEESRRLYPADPALAREVDSLVTDFDAHIGTTARRLVYCHLVDAPHLFVETMTLNTSRIETALVRLLYPVQLTLLKRAFQVSDRARRELPGRLVQALTGAERRLADGRPYLTGDRFTAADLTLVSMLQPVLRSRQESLDGLPSDYAALVSSVRVSPVGTWAQRVWREQRTARA